MQTIGESREAWGWDVWRKAEEFAAHLKKDMKPFYIVYAAKADKSYSNVFRQAFRFYRQKPPKVLGLLVWFVDHSKGIFRLVPELSLPPDVPIDPALLSEKAEDALTSVMQAGSENEIILS